MRQPWYQDGRHSVSPYNFDPSVTADFHWPSAVTVYDGTLRKIIVTPGVRPSVDDMLRVAEAIERAGIREVILNVAGWGDREPDRTQWDVARAILARKFAFHVNLWGEYLMPRPMYKAIYDDHETPRRTLEAFAEAGADTVVVPLRSNEPMAGSDAVDRQAEWLDQIFDTAGDRNIRVSVDFLDPGRIGFEEVVARAEKCIALGVRHLGVLDSLGSMSPEATRFFIRTLNSRLGNKVPLVLHVHDDFGLASATTIAAVTGGGQPDVAVNGVSYRSGHASLEQVVVSLEVLYGISTGLNLNELTHLSETVTDKSGLPARPLQPITGRHAFMRDSASGAVPIMTNGPDAWPPSQSTFAPSLVGQRMEIVWGIHTSDFWVEAKLSQLGIPSSPMLVGAIRADVDRRLDSMTSYPFWLTDEQMEDICRTHAQKLPNTETAAHPAST